MEIKLFTIPLMGGEKQEMALNAFLRSRKILQVENQLVNNDQGAYWCFCVKYIEENTTKTLSAQKEKPDYKSILNQAGFIRFSKFREIRKAVAQEDAVPAYAVFTDAELAEIAKSEENISLSDLRSIRGIGKNKIEKYGHHFISKDEKSKGTDRTNYRS